MLKVKELIDRYDKNGMFGIGIAILSKSDGKTFIVRLEKGKPLTGMEVLEFFDDVEIMEIEDILDDKNRFYKRLPLVKMRNVRHPFQALMLDEDTVSYPTLHERVILSMAFTIEGRTYNRKTGKVCWK